MIGTINIMKFFTTFNLRENLKRSLLSIMHVEVQWIKAILIKYPKKKQKSKETILLCLEFIRSLRRPLRAQYYLNFIQIHHSLIHNNSPTATLHTHHSIQSLTSQLSFIALTVAIKS